MKFMPKTWLTSGLKQERLLQPFVMNLVYRKKTLFYANLFQETFSSSKVRVVVEGINWGMNTAVYLGINEPGCTLYSIHQLINERQPEQPVTGSQTDQLYGYAQYLITYATDILQGDTSFFNRQDELKKKEQEEALKTRQAEAAQKLGAGYIKIDNPYFDEPVWRKPRPTLSTYSITKEKYPNSIEVFFNENDTSSTGDYSAVITGWKADLDSTVLKDTVLCEISTDKVWMEIMAPQTGRLVWLLEEGITLNASSCIALIVPD
jgi:hypothetical protein